MKFVCYIRDYSMQRKICLLPSAEKLSCLTSVNLQQNLGISSISKIEYCIRILNYNNVIFCENVKLMKL